MKNLFNARAPSFDAQAINETIRRALASAGLDTSSGPMHDVTETIRRALASGSPFDAAKPSTAADEVIDVVARVVETPEEVIVAPGVDTLEGQARVLDTPATETRPAAGDLPEAEAPATGTFEAHEFSNQAGSRVYKNMTVEQVGEVAARLKGQADGGE